MAAQREWFEKDYYQVLGVSDTATQKEITSAYRKLARQLHPDANPDDATAEERFKEVSAAYDVVGDAEKRKEYDEVRRLGPMGAAGGPGGFGGFAPGGANFGDGTTGFTFTTDDLGNLLGGLFNRGRGGRGGPTAPGGTAGGGVRQGVKGADIEAELHLDFTEAVGGVTTEVNLVSDVRCETCSGSGSKPGTSPKICSRCGGKGSLDDNQGFFSFSQPCPACGGRGTVIEEACPTCHGSGTERKSRAVKVRIPAGVDDGQRIRLAGRGGPGRNGGPAGDLFVTVRVEPHAIFGRSGKNLTLVAPITYPEAVLGANIKVPTLGGSPVTLKVPAGTPSGRTFRVKGRGVVPTKGTKGDLLVTVEVAVPKKLSDEERTAIKALADIQSDESPRAHLGV